MGIVHFPADVVDADHLPVLHADRIGDEAGHEVFAEDLAGQLAAEVLMGPRRVHLVGAVHPVQEVRDPAGAALAQGDLQGRVLLDGRRPQQVRSGLHDVHRLQGDHHIHRGVRRGDGQLARRSDVHVHHGFGVHQRIPHRLPVVHVVERRVPQRRRVLGEGQRVHALLRHPADLLGAQLGIPDRRQRHRDETARLARAPLVDVPVVVGLHQRHREFAVVGGEQPGGEAGERREVHGGQHAAGTHVLDAFGGVVAALADLVETLRLESVLLLGPAGDRVERDVGNDGVAELPGIRAVGIVHEPRRLVLVLLREVVLEHVRRLDDVVIDADQDHVVLVHACSLPY